MTRSIDPLFDPRLADWLEEDDSTAPEQALEIVLASFPSIKQRRVIRVPWRTTSMSTTLRLGLAAAVVVAALGSIYFLGSRSTSSVAGPETQAPSVSPSEAPSNGAPAGSLSTFSSRQYGYSVEYPTPYAAVPATEPWPDDGQIGPEEPWVDRFFAPNSATFVGIAAMPKAEGATDEEFATAYQQLVAERGCPVPLDAWSDARVGDQPARRAEFQCGGARAVELIWIDGDTGYVITGEPAVVDLMAESFTRD